jgi:hypothetical protein
MVKILRGPFFEKKLKNSNLFTKKRKGNRFRTNCLLLFFEIKYKIIYLISTNHGFHLIIRQPLVAVVAAVLVQLS